MIIINRFAQGELITICPVIVYGSLSARDDNQGELLNELEKIQLSFHIQKHLLDKYLSIFFHQVLLKFF